VATALSETPQPAPTAALLLIGYNQAATIDAAIDGAFAQDYAPLEIVLSDDASGDDTFARMQARAAAYRGPHRVLLNRNPRNLGIGAHLTQAAATCSAEMLFVAAGDDVSLPQRVSRCMAEWNSRGRVPDLIAGWVQDVDIEGAVHDVLRPSDLARWRTPADWARERPYVIGAAQCWTRRLLERFGGLPEGVVAEDLVMSFRAIGCGGAITLPEPLVRYRRGGISRRVRTHRADQVVERLLKNNRHALVELPLLLRDADTMGPAARAAVEPVLAPQLARERFIADLFGAATGIQAWRALRAAAGVPWPVRLRMAVYARARWLLAPVFALKRALQRD
jgi:glycosyltransferase involved in cell wall biosynthesis